MQIAQGRAHIAHRVQHVGPDDEVECARFKFLAGARFFEIENLEFTSGNAASFCARRRKTRPRRR
jgi:hypothetical protein